jgi:hypothetical protein
MEACNLNLQYRDFFKANIFSRELTNTEIDEAEDFLGIPFNYLFFSNQRRWSSIQRKGLEEKLAKYVYAWKEILRDTDVLISFMENLFFVNIAELVADRLGVKIIKVVGSGMLPGGLMFWDKNNSPIFYKATSESEALQHLVRRTTQQKRTARLINPVNRLHNVLKKVPKMLKRISIRIRDKRKELDADIPSFWSECWRISSTALRYVLYPKLHWPFFDKPREGEKFFILPLHFEWEAQITLREPFLDQLNLARQISKALPHDTYLYVKVHPHWKNADQGLLPVYRLKREKQLRLIRPEENTIELIKKCLGVIVVNSTVGYEALVFKKPLIVWGHEIYRKVGIDIKDINNLPRALSALKNGTYKVNAESYEQFLKEYSSQVINVEDTEEFAKEIKNVMLWSLTKS